MKAKEIGLCLCAMGLLGLGFGVEYSGWVLFIGLVTAV